MAEQVVTCLFQDVDKTLAVNYDRPGAPKGTVHPVDIAAMRALEASGVELVHATSRTHDMMRNVMEQTGVANAVLDGGATIVIGGEEDPALREWLPADVTGEIVDQLLPLATLIGYNNVPYCMPVTPHLLQELPPEESPSVFAVFPAGDGHREDIEQALINTGFGDLMPHYNDFNQPGLWCVQVALANKAHGLRKYQKVTGITPERSAAIGDGESDREMFARAALKLVMRGGTLEALEPNNPNYVYVPTVDEHGYHTAAEHILTLNGAAHLLQQRGKR